MRKVMGWDIDGLKSEVEKENFEKAQKDWKDKRSKGPVLNENNSGEDLQKEAEWIQQNIFYRLYRHCKKIKVCGRSRRWCVRPSLCRVRHHVAAG